MLRWCAAAALAFVVGSAEAAEYRVIDGDTIALGRRTIRVYGIDAPEIHQYRCPAEKALGLQSRDALKAMLASGKTRVVKVKKRTRAGALEPIRDKYGRELSRVFVDGKNVGDLLIAQGLAKAYFGKTKSSWC